MTDARAPAGQPLQAVFFDASGVLYRRERRYGHLLDFLRRHGLPTPAPEELQRLRTQVHRRLTAASRRERYDAFLGAIGVAEPAQRAEGLGVLEREAAQITLLPDVAATLRTLKERGFKLGVITNTATPGAEKRRWLVAHGVDVAFDSFVASCEVGVAKPHRRIYELALAQCRVTPQASVFVGHDATEIGGARAVGMATVALDETAALAADHRIARFGELLGLACLQAAQAAGISCRRSS